MQKDLLLRILGSDALTAVFQPIVHLEGMAPVGYEGLARGPAGTPLHAPAALFEAARACGLAAELEDRCRSVVLAAFGTLGLAGKLFLNASRPWFAGPGAQPRALLEQVRAAGLEADRIVIELTEGERPVDADALRGAAARYVGCGFQVAIDDLGGGFSSLQLWSELRPDFVKVDMYFVRGIDRDRVRLQFMRSIQDIARVLGTAVIVEGIETDAELALVRDLGIACGQGYRIGRPAAVPDGAPLPATPAPVLVPLPVGAAGAAAAPAGHLAHQPGATALRLLRAVAPASPAMTNSDLFGLFARNPDLEVVPVVDHDVPVGLITRRTLLGQFATQFIRELHGRKPCTMFMDPRPLVVDRHTALQDLSKSVADAERHHLFNGFIITAEGKYLGMGTGHDLVREITSLQISAARYANPLTGLPGNVPINEHIDRLLAGGTRFAACYFDLDHFKPFNDFYGYRQGDDVIQLTGRVLEAHADPSRDFVGHIGGDDFLILFQSEDWEARCRAILEAFAHAIAGQFDEAALARGGYIGEDRSGQQVLHPLVTLSAGIVKVEPGCFSSHLQIAALASEAKKQAKRIAGNSLFVDRRGGPGGRPAGGAGT